jgi:hypothetical protein
MRYLKLFENHQSESEVAKICKKYGIKKWSINSDGLVDVNGNVNLNNQGLTEIPLKFGKVTGDFSCVRNKLTTLKGCPNTVDGCFSCNYNNLTSLEFCPRRVGGGFDCDNNRLTSLEFCPRSVGRHFYCQWNNIREFTGLKYIGGFFGCYDNPIFNIWKIISPNEIWDEDQMDYFEDLYIIQDDGESVAIDRLNFFLEEVGLNPVKKVNGYNNI